MKTLLFAVGCLACLSFTLAQQSGPPVAAREFPGAAETLRGFGTQGTAPPDSTTATPATREAGSPGWKYETVVWPVPELNRTGGPSDVSKFSPLAKHGDWDLVSAVSSTAIVKTGVAAGESDLKVPVPVIIFTLRNSQP